MEYTIKQAAIKAGQSPTTIRRKIKEGVINAEKKEGPYGPQYYISEEELEGYLSTLAQEITEVIPVKESLSKSDIIDLFNEALEKRDQELLDRLDRIEQSLEERDQKLMEVMRSKVSMKEEKRSLLDKIKGLFVD